MLRAKRAQSPLIWRMNSGVYKYFLCTHVENQPAVVNLRAVVLLIWRIWAGNDAGRIMRVATPGWIGS